jgi:hypothetical protein
MTSPSDLTSKNLAVLVVDVLVDQDQALSIQVWKSFEKSAASLLFNFIQGRVS